MVRPVTVAEVAEPLLTCVGVCAVEPIYGVTVYDVIGLPLAAGAVQLTIAWPDAGIAVTPVGAPGAVGPVGVTEFDAADAGPDALGVGRLSP